MARIRRSARQSWLRTAGEIGLVALFLIALLVTSGALGLVLVAIWLLLALIAASRHAGFWLGVVVVAVLAKMAGCW